MNIKSLNAIIVTRSKAEVEELHKSVWGKFEDWPHDSFSVDTGDYNDKWDWILKGGKLCGSKGPGNLERIIRDNSELPIVYGFNNLLKLASNPPLILTPGAQVFNTERIKQVNQYGFSIKYSKDHPEYYADGQMAYAAAQLLWADMDFVSSVPPKNWNKEWWDRMRSKDYKERLEIAGALLIAEYERLYIEEK